MLKQLALFTALLTTVVFTHDTATQEQFAAEYKAAGMSQATIDGLQALSQKFASEYPLVQANKEQADNFIADYTVEAQNYVAAMNPQDKKIYAEMLVKNGLA